MNKEEIAEVARVAAQEVLARKDAIIDEEFDARYHDVNLLMKNYRKLRRTTPTFPRRHWR